MATWIQNGTIVTAEGQLQGDILIENGVIAQMGQVTAPNADVIDAAGKLVLPGLVDMHCHLREPGFEYKEDIVSGSRAAVAGGFTSVACMPNTQPVCDDEGVLAYIRKRAQEVNLAKIYPIAAITKGLEGRELTEMGYLQKAGAVAFSDDGKPVASSLMMRNALLYAKNFDALLISHCEDLELVNNGAMNEGLSATITGLRGNTRAAEETMLAREIILAEAYQTRVHIAHVSTALGVELVRAAKRRGVQVTCETCPHYFSATEEACLTYDTNAKINPPLRTRADVEAIKAGLADGTIDAVATDHAPHHLDDKQVEFELAANGTSGLETALPLTYALVREGVLTWEQLIMRMAKAPAGILGIAGGTLAVGGCADITLFDPNEVWTVRPEELYTKGKNTLFAGWELTGRVTDVFVNGRQVVKGKVVLPADV